MSVPDFDSIYCNKEDCGVYNVLGYCEYHIVSFFNWLNLHKLELTTDNFDTLWKKYDESNIVKN